MTIRFPRFAASAALISLYVVCGQAKAQAVGLEHEYDEKVEAARSISPLSEGMFGNQTSLANGSTEFSAVDIDIPGNNALPVRLGRRLPIDDRYLPEELGGLGNWDIDVPYIEGTFSSAYGWTVASPSSPLKNMRCTYAGQPYVDGVKFSAEEVWHGYNLHIPGGGSETLLLDGAGYADPTDTTGYKWTLKSQGKLRCLSILAEGSPGEGFLLRQPDGTKYYFDFPVERTVRKLQKSRVPGYIMERKRIFMLATKIEDRFGNTVHFTYETAAPNKGRLISITARDNLGVLDGRAITLAYPNASTITAQAGGKTWTYGLQSGHLTSVTQPGGEQWLYSPFGSLSAYAFPFNGEAEVNLAYFDPGAMCTASSLIALGTATFTVTHPSGAQGTFQFEGKRFSRANVPYYCVIDYFEHNVRTLAGVMRDFGSSGAITGQALIYQTMVQMSMSYNEAVRFLAIDMNPPVEDPSYLDVEGYARILIPNTYDVFSLQTQTLQGSGIETAVTSYSYEEKDFPYCGTFDSFTGLPNGQDCEEDACISISCADGLGRWTTITLPTGEKIRKRHGVVYGVNEGLLLNEEVRTVSDVLVRSTEYTYQPGNAIAPQVFAADAGGNLVFDPMASRMTPLLSSKTTQDGVDFSYEVSNCGSAYCFDAMARPTKVRKWSSLGHSRLEEFQFQDNLQFWVLGLQTAHTVAGTITSETVYDHLARPTTFKNFGYVDSTLSWNGDGTLAWVKDANENQTTFSAWERGIPKHVLNADTTTRTAVVSALGWITQSTDENGFATNYTYDEMGRLASIIYPTGDTTAWNTTTLEFKKTTATELWFPAGTWRQTVRTGNGHKVTYYDALWRPRVTHEYDSANVAGTSRFSALRYDKANRATFASYPIASATSDGSFVHGAWSEYDALGRPTSTAHDTDASPAVTLVEYLSGFKTRVTNPRGHATTTSFLAYDQPDTSSPLVIDAPEGLRTTITRDAFGRTTTVNRSGTQPGQIETLSRHYVYGGRGRLCKSVEPETGATHYDYDLVGNLIRTIQGDQTYTGLTCDSVNVPIADKTLMTYDVMNRLLRRDVPGVTGGVEYTYHLDGLVHTSTALHSDGFAPAMTLSYNKRRLLVFEAQSSTGWGSGYTYNANGFMSGYWFPDVETVDLAPNALGQPTQAGSYATGVQYFPNGAIKQFTYGNGIQHSSTQNVRQLPARALDLDGVTAVVDFETTYDANGNTLAIFDDAQMGHLDRTMTYDGLDRLVTAYAPGLWGNGSYTYDVLDNLRTRTQGGVTHTYNYDVKNRLASVSFPGGSWPYVHDARGNITQRGGFHHVYDQANRLRSTAGTPWYSYDAAGRRLLTCNFTACNHQMYGQSGQLMFEVDNRVNERRSHVYLGSRLIAIKEAQANGANPQVIYQHADALGSPVAETNAARQVLARTEYAPYGQTLNRQVSGPGFTGHVMDAGTGLTYMQQRYYDQAIGRFVSVDPVATSVGDGSAFNRYRYAANNPYFYTDPDGREEEAWAQLGETISLEISKSSYRNTKDPKSRAAQARTLAVRHRMIGAYTDAQRYEREAEVWTRGITMRNPAHIRFVQDSISEDFQGGEGSIDALVRQLHESSGEDAKKILPIRVFEQAGVLYTLDHRRLEAHRQAGYPIQTVMATAEEVAFEKPRKARSSKPNYDGVKVRIRRGRR